jgi:hypothetical protein
MVSGYGTGNSDCWQDELFSRDGSGLIPVSSFWRIPKARKIVFLDAGLRPASGVDQSVHNLDEGHTASGPSRMAAMNDREQVMRTLSFHGRRFGQPLDQAEFTSIRHALLIRFLIT